MKRILFVEDDVLIAKVYGQKLIAEGFDVMLAADGLAAVQLLRQIKPDLVILDLLMPKLTGVDVLKFIRQSPELKNTRIIVFSNSFLSNLIEQVAAIGVEEALVKAAVTPARLVEVINNTLTNAPRAFLSAEAMTHQLSSHAAVLPPVNPKLAAPPPPPDRGSTSPVPAKNGPTRLASPPASAPASLEKSARSDSDTASEKQFLEHAPQIMSSVRQICREFLEAENSTVEPRKLEDLRRKIGFVAQTLGMAGRHRFAQLATALEALLFDLREKPGAITDSNRHTIASTVTFMAERLTQAKPEDKNSTVPLKVLAVDDDAVSGRAVVMALGRANLSAASVADPFEGLKRLQENSYDLVLLDINMPGLDGIQLCEQMRALPQHKSTPVIFVTSQTDFKTRARSILSGANDLITKPIMPTELCVKALAHLLQQPPAAHNA